MHNLVSDLIYATRNLCEALRERNDIIDEELKDFLEEAESCIEELSSEEENDDLLE